AGFVTNAGAGSFTIQNGRNFTTSAAFLNAGQLTVGAGSSFDISGNYSQMAGGTLNIHLGAAPGLNKVKAGPLSGSQGTPSLDGGSRVVETGGYQPSQGDSFQVLSFAIRSGNFATMDGLDLGAGLVWQPQFNPTNLRLTAFSIPHNTPPVAGNDALALDEDTS